MEDVNAKDLLVAYVTMKTRSGLSIHRDIRKLSLRTIDSFLPVPDQVDQVVRILTHSGFKIVARTAAGVTFSGPLQLFRSEFQGSTFKPQEMLLREPEGPDEEKADKKKSKRKKQTKKNTEKPTEKVVYYISDPRLMINKKLENLAESVHLSSPGKPFHKADPPSFPNPKPYYLNVLMDVPALLNVSSLHAAGITGKGVRVSMVDTGFINRVTEEKTPYNTKNVNVDHEIRHVFSVRQNGVEYYGNNDFFSGSLITLTTPLDPLNQVTVDYSCLHPHYLPPNHQYSIDDIRVPDGLGSVLDVNRDGEGHGTAMAANALAVAPGCNFSFVKYFGEKDSEEGDKNKSNLNCPLAGFMAAVQHQNPDIISCSWGPTSPEDQAAVTFQAVAAVARGIVVVFAAGNYDTEDDDWKVDNFPVTHPNVISVGGAYPEEQYPSEDERFNATNYAASYDSVIWVNPQRHCPDVVGIIGKYPGGNLIVLPTEPNCFWDWNSPSCNSAQKRDGWAIMSGTSAATQQAAGVAALLLQLYPGLAPMSVKNILEDSARDVTVGKNYQNVYAGPGWDPATGFGLIDGQAAVDYLKYNLFVPFIRDTVEDNGTEPLVPKIGADPELWASPDIIVRSELVDDPQDELGQTVKYRSDLCDLVEYGQDNYIYLRIQNRGTLTGDCMASVYLTKSVGSNQKYNLANWTKIDRLKIQNLESGEFRVAGPILWPADMVPAKPNNDNYCLIVILDSPGDPSPGLTAPVAKNDFIKLVKDSNNLAWRKIDVENIIDTQDPLFSLSFHLQRPYKDPQNPYVPDYSHPDLEINIKDFLQSDIWVKVTNRLMSNNTSMVKMTKLQTNSPTHTTLKFMELGVTGKLQRVTLNPGEETKVTVYYTIPQRTQAGVYPIIATLKSSGPSVEYKEEVSIP